MFNKYIGLSLGIIAICIVIFYAVAAFLFSKALHKVVEYTDARMIAAAQYTDQYLTIQLLESVEEINEDEIDQWLEQYILGVGFERIIITDTIPTVLWSSHELIQRGDDYLPYIIDDSLFARAITMREPLISSTKKIGSVYFKSLYYPCFINTEPGIISIDVNHQYFQDAAWFRTMIVMAAVFLMILSCIMVGILYYLNKKAKQAFRKIEHNERLAFLGRTSAELAHELKNPLGIIKTSVDVLRLDHDPQKENKAFSFISEEIMHISHLIENILSFSRDKIIHWELIRPTQILQEFLISFNKIYPTITTNIIIPENYEIKGDSTIFRMIAGNLLQNAANAMEGTGTITISKGKIKGKEAILFTNSGPGIDKRLAKKIFEPFVTSSKTGTGLGLAIIQSLCERLEWDIQLQSSVKGCTSFALFI